MIIPESANNRTPTLSQEHKRILTEGSAISPSIVAGRGYWTVTSRAQLVGMFPKWQRRAPALAVPMYSPDGVTTSAQIRPRTPRTRNGKVVKYETALGAGLILDVHPSMQTAVRDASTPLLITEGVKTADSATTQGLCTIALTGVECWQSKGIPLPCWEHVALEGRSVFVAFDSDCMTKREVQGALKRLVAFLEGRGADVQVIYLPAAPDGSKQGIDDYLASAQAGGTVPQMMMLARRFVPEDLARVRLSRDEKLRTAIEDLWRDWRDMPVKTMGQNTRRSVVRILNLEGERSGKVLKGGRVRVVMDRRTLTERTASSARATQRAIEHLEDEGRLKRDNAGRKRDKAGAFTLIPQERAQGKQYGGREPGGGELTPSRENTSDRRDYPARAPRTSVPELRWSTTLKHREKDRRGRPVLVYDHLVRLGKRCAAVLEHLEERGGSAGISELMGRFAGKRTRPRDFKRRTLAPLAGWRYDRKLRRWLTTGPAIITVDDAAGTVALVDGWQDALKRHRESADELEAARLQAQKHARQREAYRRRDETEAEPVPDMRPIPDMRKPWPVHPTGCACPECVKRFGEPSAQAGEHPDDCKCAPCFTVRKEEEQERARAEGRRVVPIAPHRRRSQDRPPAALPHEEAQHPWHCDCPECGPEPSYARPWGAA